MVMLWFISVSPLSKQPLSIQWWWWYGWNWYDRNDRFYVNHHSIVQHSGTKTITNVLGLLLQQRFGEGDLLVHKGTILSDRSTISINDQVHWQALATRPIFIRCRVPIYYDTPSDVWWYYSIILSAYLYLLLLLSISILRILWNCCHHGGFVMNPWWIFYSFNL